jgi:hypothetical protein
MRFVLTLLSLGLAASAAAAPADEPRPEARSGTVVEMQLEADLGHVTLRQLEMLRLLVRAAQIMDTLYERQLSPDGFYPADMSPEEFAAWDEAAATSPYTRIMRDPQGALQAVPYHEAWPAELGHAARLLARAGEVTTNESLRSYLTLRARALITGDHPRADAAWQAVRDSDIEVLIGPLGTDADRAFGLKAAFGAYVLLRDWAWGVHLGQLKVLLPRMQHDLPVSAAFKGEVPDVDAKLAVYDLLYQAGYKRLRMQYGPGGLQLRNVMRARFDALVLPVADMLLIPEQRAGVGFEAHFMNSLLHQMAHSLGLRHTIDQRATVHVALREHADTIEEAKAAALSLWMIDWLHAQGELPATARMEHHASFLAGVVQAIHLDAYGPAGQARLLLFNYFRDWGAFRRDAETGRYLVEAANMGQAIEALAAQLLVIQGSGDYHGAAALIESLAVARPEMRATLEQLGSVGIPAAIVFRQDDELPGL